MTAARETTVRRLNWGCGKHPRAGWINSDAADWYGVDYYLHSPREDPKGPETGTFRVTRGGAFDSRPELCRSGYRNDAFPPDYRGPNVGFRCARDE